MKQLPYLVIAILTMAALHRACWADEKREVNPRSKGAELYSWKNKGGNWMCVLLNGTNRIGGGPRDDPPAAAPDTDRPTGTHPSEVLLDGSEHGQMFPAFADIDGDGKLDMVVGVTDQISRPSGRLLVYVNRGTKTRPKYAKPSWFDETAPSGRIPDG